MKNFKKNLKKYFVIAMSALFVFALFGHFDTKRANKLFKQGLEFQSKKDYQNAYYNFARISRFSYLYEISLLKQALCAINIGDNSTAKSKFNHLAKITKNEHIAPVALYRSALFDLKDKKNNKAYSKFKKLYNNYPDSDYKKASSYQLALLMKEKYPYNAKDLFLEYIEYAPNGVYGLESVSILKKMDLKLEEDEKLALGRALFLNEQYTNAKEMLKGLMSANSLVLKGKVYEKLKENTIAKKCFYKALEVADEKVKPEDISYATMAYAKYSGLYKKDAYLYLLNNINNQHSNPAVLFELAQVSPKIAANSYYEKIYKKYPKSHFAAHSLFKVFWYTYKNGYYKTAKELANLYLENYKNKKSTPAMKFWLAKIYLKEHKTRTANGKFEHLIKTEPTSYYSYIAKNILNKNQTPFNTKEFLLPESKEFSEKDLKSLFSDDEFLCMLAQYKDVESLDLFKFEDDFIKSYIAHLKGNYWYSVSLAHLNLSSIDRDLPASDIRYKLAHPIYYGDLIKKYSEKYNQNPLFIISLIKAESGFDKNASSFANAHGLMQLLPSTASELGFGRVRANDLYDAKFNIELGTKYLSQLKQMFSNEEMYATMSYNGGAASVLRWKQNHPSSDFDEFVEDVPYIETQNYIKKVFENYHNYTRIYDLK